MAVPEKTRVFLKTDIFGKGAFGFWLFGNCDKNEGSGNFDDFETWMQTQTHMDFDWLKFPKTWGFASTHLCCNFVLQIFRKGAFGFCLL